MKSKKWLTGWFVLVMIMLAVIGGLVYKVDPYFHYHKPDTKKYYYSLYNQRSQNDGISRHFDYDALITGTSMVENFKTSEFNEEFGVNAIKVPYAGASYKEINDNLVVALESNPELKTIVRCLDYNKFFDDKDLIRSDLGQYPDYLYDRNPFNDVYYLFNRDVIFDRVFVMTEEEKDVIYGNITQNVTSLAEKYPDVDFYYFFSPYSAAWWAEAVSDGTICKWTEAEEYIIELILDHENIKLYSFNNCTEITTNLNYYKDTIHYGEWINSFMLKAMHDGAYLLTGENYKNYIREELDFYTTFDYNSLNEQKD